jgi:uncharacterized protein (DUF924 family)
MENKASELLEFWFSEPMNQHWFKSTPAIDRDIAQRYGTLWQQGANGELDHWLQSAQTCLALIVLLDQLPLNMFRGQAKSFSTEKQAIEACLYGLEQDYDQQLSQAQQAFFYMPLMHSEQLSHQQRSVELYERSGLTNNLRFARHHCELIERFGRFPHRNAILGRIPTPAEIAYLQSDKAFKG